MLYVISTGDAGEYEQGMELPVIQARLQAQFLRRLMSEKDGRVLDGQLGGLLPKHFSKHWPIDIIVAVSDAGRISRGLKVPELPKADQAAGVIQAIVQRHSVAVSHPTCSTRTPPTFSSQPRSGAL